MLWKVAKTVWVGLTVFVLSVTMYFYDGTPHSDIAVFLAWAMLILSFPSSLVFAFLDAVTVEALREFFSISIQVSYPSLLLYWFGHFVLGYLQWFHVVPFLWKKWRRGKQGATEIFPPSSS